MSRDGVSRRRRRTATLREVLIPQGLSSLDYIVCVVVIPVRIFVVIVGILLTR